MFQTTGTNVVVLLIFLIYFVTKSQYKLVFMWVQLGYITCKPANVSAAQNMFFISLKKETLKWLFVFGELKFSS